MRPFCIRDLADATRGRLQLGALPPLAGDLEPVGPVAFDVADVRPGSVFWFLPGDARRAVCLEEAFALGAMGVVSSGPRVEPWAGRFSLLVDDPQRALADVVSHRRHQLTGPLIAVAGPMGKTTTAHWIHAGLRSHWKGTLCRHPARGPVPLPLLELDPDAHYGLLEVGDDPVSQGLSANSLGRPDIVVALDPVPSMAGESEGWVLPHPLQDLYDALGTTGWLILNGDHPHTRRSLQNHGGRQILTVGRGSHCDLTADAIGLHDGWLHLRVGGRELTVPAWGRHHLHSVLAAYAIGRILDLPHESLQASLQHYRPAVGACQVVHTRTITLVADRAAQRPAAVQAALDVLRELNVSGRRIVVCADGADTTTARPEFFRSYAESIICRCGADRILGIGPAGGELVSAARQAGMAPRYAIACESAADALAALRSWLRAGDAVLITAHDQRELDNWIQSLTPLTVTAAA